MDNYTLSDIRAVTDGERNDGFGGFGGGGLLIIVMLFLFMFGGFGNGGFGWGNNAMGGALTRAEMQQGFDTAEVTRKLDGLTQGLCDGFYAQNTTMLNGFAGVTAAVNDARFASQQCCCETNRNIDAVRYEAQKNACDIITASSANTQKILDAIAGNRMADMQNQINHLQLQAALCGVVRYPQATTYSAGYSPFCGCGGCCGGNNI